MKEIILISTVIVSFILFFLVFKTMKNETYFKNEITRLNRQINELNSSAIKLTPPSSNNPTPPLNTDSNSNNKLQDEYNDYLETNFNNQEELPDDLKDKINELQNSEIIEDGIDQEHLLSSYQEFSQEQEPQENEEAQLQEQELQDNEEAQLQEQELQENEPQENEPQENEPQEQEPQENEEAQPQENEPQENEEAQLQEQEPQENEPQPQESHEYDAIHEPEPDIISNILEETNSEMIESYKKYSLDDLEKMSIKELQEIARENRLKIKGKKNELVERVKAFYNFNNNLI
jgi:hypothetical protein